MTIESNISDMHENFYGHHLIRVRRQDFVPIRDDQVPEGQISEVSSQNAFRDGFASSFTMILLAEIADKTFFIAAIMAMRYNKMVVFIGAYSALVIMTGLSCALGFVVNLIPSYITHYVAGTLFCIFAIQMIYEAHKMRGQSAQNELEEVAAEMREEDEELRVRFRKDSKSEENHGEANIVVEIMPSDAEKARSRSDNIKKNSVETKSINSSYQPEEIASAATSLTTVEGHEMLNATKSCLKKSEKFFSIFINPVFVKAFILTFIAEWGDRSQLSTVTLATTTNMYAVFIGGCLGHLCCTLAAIIFGSTIAKKVSMTILNLCGGLLFLGFSAFTFYLAATGLND